jgi:hypothetical protein
MDDFVEPQQHHDDDRKTMKKLFQHILPVLGVIIFGVYSLTLVILCNKQSGIESFPVKVVQAIFGMLVLISPVTFVLSLISFLVTLKIKNRVERLTLFVVNLIAIIITGYFIFTLVCFLKIGPINPG